MQDNKNFVRKHFFINRQLQGRYMLTFLIPMLAMLVFMLFSLYFASKTVVDTTTNTIKQEFADSKVMQFQDQEPTVELYETFFDDMNNYLRNYSSDKTYKTVVLKSLLWVFGIGVFLVIIQIVLLTVFFSHKLAGPIYRFEVLCRNVINGDYTDSIHLRKGDEMQNLSKLLNSVVKISRDRLVELNNAENLEEKNKIMSKLKV